MDILNKNVAMNLKRIRKSKNMSLDAVAEQTGISKSMLGQIEREKTNPTLSILGKLVSGLRVEFMDLVGSPPLETYLIREEELEPTKIMESKYEVYVYFPYNRNEGFEIYSILIWPGASYISESHGEGTREYVVVQQGEMSLEMEREKHVLKKNDAIRFETHDRHIYHNTGQELLKISVVFSWDK